MFAICVAIEKRGIVIRTERPHHSRNNIFVRRRHRARIDLVWSGLYVCALVLAMGC